MASLAAMITAIKRQVPVVPGLSSRAAQPLPSAMPREEDVLDPTEPMAQVKTSESTRTAFDTLSDAMKAMCSL